MRPPFLRAVGQLPRRLRRLLAPMPAEKGATEPVVVGIPLILPVTSVYVSVDFADAVRGGSAVVALEGEDEQGRTLGPESFTDVEWSEELGMAFRRCSGGPGGATASSVAVFELAQPVQRLSVHVRSSDVSSRPPEATALRWSVGNGRLFSSGMWEAVP